MHALVRDLVVLPCDTNSIWNSCKHRHHNADPINNPHFYAERRPYLERSMDKRSVSSTDGVCLGTELQFNEFIQRSDRWA